MKTGIFLRRLAGIAAAIAAASATFALVTWRSGDWTLGTFGPSYVPMAPITAVLSTALALSLALQAREASSRTFRAIGTFGAFLAVAVGSLVLVQTGWNIPLPWDNWMVTGTSPMGSPPIGRMAPLTAGTFLLTGLAALRWPAAFAFRAGLRWIQPAAATGGLLVGGAVILGYFSGTPFLYSGNTVPMALLTAITFAALNGGFLLTRPVDKHLLPWQQDAAAMDQSSENRVFFRTLIAVVAALGILIVVLGAVYLRSAQLAARLSASAELKAIAELKVNQIHAWRNERLDEANFLLRTPDVTHDVLAFLAQPGDADARAQLLGWLESIKGGSRYETVLVLDATGRAILTIPFSIGEATRVSSASLARVLTSTEPVFTDLERAAGDTAIHLDLLVPIRPSASGPATAPIAVIVLRLNPERVLFPLVGHWPLPSATAESLLVRREGDEVVYASHLRHLPDAPLTVRRALTDTMLGAARAVRGEFGTFEGRDYRNVPVLSAIRPIPDTPWMLIAEADQAEIYAPIRREAWHTGALVIVLLATVALTGVVLWRQRHAAYLHRALVAEEERNAVAARLALITRHANDVIMLFDEAMHVVEANDRALAVYGYTATEIRRLTTRDLRAPGAVGTLDRDFAEALTTEGHRFETDHRRRDGSMFPVEVSARRIEIDGRPHVLSILRDITQRRAHELEIARLNRVHLVISQVNQALVRAATRHELFAEICRVLVHTGRFRIAWIGWLNRKTQRVEPVATAGDEHGYVASLHISAESDQPEGRGPSGTAFHGGRTYVCNDFFAEPSTAPWREAAAHSGFQSSIALPLRCDGEPLGLLTVYAAEKDFFAAQEIGLLEETANDVSFALGVFEARARQLQAEISLQESHAFNLSVLDSIIDHIAVLDAQGIIIAVNATWRAFAEQNGATHFGAGDVGTSYLSACTAALNSSDALDASNARAGILAVITGAKPEFVLDYPCHSPTERRWFQMRVTPLVGARCGVVVAHKNISADRLAGQQLSKLSRIIEQAPLSVVITDLSGRIEYVNPKFCTVTGYTPEEVHGKNPRVLKSGETAAEIYRDMWTTLGRGDVWSGELRNRKKNGDLYVETAVIAPVVDEAGRATHYVALKEDITERTRTERALREMQERYRLIAENSDDVIWLYDLSGHQFSYCSPSVKKLRGFSAEEVLGQSLIEVITPASSELVVHDLPGRLAAFAAGDLTVRTQVHEVEQTHRDGSVVPTEVVTTLLVDSHGQVSQILGVSRNVTERVKARESLLRFNAELEEKVGQRTTELGARNREMQALLDAIPDTVMRVRVDGTVLLHQPARDSAALAALTRSSDGEKPSAIPNELIAPSIQIGRRALQEMATVTAETEIVIPHGKVAVELRVAPVGPEEIVVFARDITARKRLEAETAAMFEKERQLLEMKTRFISVTSHEFRTPMAAALGSAQLLHNHLDRLAPEKREELFERINTSLHRMTVMLDDVLLLNRMDGHRIELRLAPADLRAFLRNVIEEIRLGDQGAHPFELQADPHDAQPFVTDLNLLHHIFSNLLSNAVRYSAAGKPIAVWVENHPGYTRVVVEDQGIGIPVADRARLFQPFERGSNVGNIKGTGLGLNIVKRMTELLGGTVALDSPADGGSRFSLVLPHLTVPASP